MNLAIKDLEDHYDDLENDFTLFFHELRDFSKNKLSAINQLFQ
jgi:acyl carrier protein phosphodiesterase